MKYLKLSIILLLFSCQGNTKDVSKSTSVEKEEQAVKEIVNESNLVDGAIGIIVESKDYQFGEVIAIFNENQKQISEIVIQEETQVLSLKCLAKEEGNYKVLFEEGKVGFIPFSEENVMFQTWQEHILNNVFAVNFDDAENPLRKEASAKSNEVYYNQDEFYHPSKIDGEWLQLKWGSEGSWEYGWIRWKHKEKLLIELFYFA